MSLPFLMLKHKDVSYKEFIEFWHKLYQYTSKDHLYTDSIYKPKISADDINNLFEWKNGMEVNGHPQKEASIRNVREKINEINILKEKFSQTSFDIHFGRMSAIWQIFLLHIINPKKFPIFDQHVFRAYIFLKSQKNEEIYKSKKKKLCFYYEEYIPFFNEVKSQYRNLRMIDGALWAFGKFLKTPYAKLIVKI